MDGVCRCPLHFREKIPVFPAAPHGPDFPIRQSPQKHSSSIPVLLSCGLCHRRGLYESRMQGLHRRRRAPPGIGMLWNYHRAAVVQTRYSFPRLQEEKKGKAHPRRRSAPHGQNHTPLLLWGTAPPLFLPRPCCANSIFHCCSPSSCHGRSAHTLCALHVWSALAGGAVKKTMCSPPWPLWFVLPLHMASLVPSPSFNFCVYTKSAVQNLNCTWFFCILFSACIFLRACFGVGSGGEMFKKYSSKKLYFPLSYPWYNKSC